MSAGRTPNILVIGGGVSGAAFALHLMRDWPHLRAEVEVVERNPRLGAGLAYTTDDPHHRMNGPADCMSILPDETLHFDNWFRQSGELDRDPDAMLAGGRVVARRAVFGRYVDETVRAAARASRHISLIHTRQQAISARRTGRAFCVTLDDGSTRQPDVLVLAVGHPPAGVPSFLEPHASATNITVDPWDTNSIREIPKAASVFIVGTGLTAADVIASLAARGHTGKIVAISRRGHLPLSRTVQDLKPFGDFSSTPARAARALLQRARLAAARHAADGGAWEDVILALREQASVVWQALPQNERRRFLRHVRSLWDSHRYPMAPQISDVVARLEANGQLAVLAAAVVGVRRKRHQCAVDLRHRGSREPISETIDADVVVNCTGPAHGKVVHSNPLLFSLAREGLLQDDPYGLGLLVDNDCRVIGSDTADQPIFALGSLTRGTFGEIIGFPQITSQPRRVAEIVASLVAAYEKVASRAPPSAQYRLPA